jgi:hypothetical protein
MNFGHYRFLSFLEAPYIFSVHQYSIGVFFEEINGGLSSLTELIIKTLYDNFKRTTKPISSKSFGIQLLLKTLYVYEYRILMVSVIV